MALWVRRSGSQCLAIPTCPALGQECPPALSRNRETHRDLSRTDTQSPRVATAQFAPEHSLQKVTKSTYASSAACRPLSLVKGARRVFVGACTRNGEFCFGRRRHCGTTNARSCAGGSVCGRLLSLVERLSAGRFTCPPQPRAHRRGSPWVPKPRLGAVELKLDVAGMTLRVEARPTLKLLESATNEKASRFDDHGQLPL